MKDLTKTEVQNIQAKEKNQESASQLMNLTDQIRLQQSTAMNEAKLNRRLEILKADTKIAKKRWRIMRSVVAAVIVGSGINWACHDEWKDFVIDEEE